MYFTLILLLFSGLGQCFTKGFNQGWQQTSYGRQWLDKYYSEKSTEALLSLNKEAGSKILRMWLYEGAYLTQFTYNQKKQELELRPEFLKNLTSFLKLARKHNTKINLTFLDGNAFSNLETRVDLKSFWWNVFNNHYGKQSEFYEKAIAPVYQLIESDFKDVVTQIDLVNEVNALVSYNFFQSQNSLKSFLCKLSSKKPVPVTASLGWHEAETHLFAGLLNQSCLDFYDVHLYNDQGTILYCNDYKRLAKKGYHFQLGEFGQQSLVHDDELQKKVTANFLANARKCGFKAALAWRLDDTREGHNPDSRFSYISDGAPRGAFYIFKEFVK
jgi:hypothetical protein